MIYTQSVNLRAMNMFAHNANGGYLDAEPNSSLPVEFSPQLLRALQEPHSIEDTGIPQEFLTGLALKILYFEGSAQGWQIAQTLRLNFNMVVEPLLQILRRQHLVQVTGGSNLNRASYQYMITEKGAQRARELLERNRYAGPCPITLRDYIEVVRLQSQHRVPVNLDDVQEAMRSLILPQDVLERIGPAVNSFKSVFIYGPPGNGKTSIGRAIARELLTGNVMIPYAIYEGGQVIKVYDAEVHPLVVSEETQLAEINGLDKRWLRCNPPIVVTGGELTLSDLDLIWSSTNRYYEAPVQLKANGGLLLVDDFGRQQVQPRDLLNRWIVPLEERLDFLTYHTGKKFAIPFETLIIFSTNLEPESLVDEAFLRRIRHKLAIENPDEQHYYRIFTNVCQERGIPFNKAAFTYLLQEHYHRVGRSYKACHPRDLLDQLIDFAAFRGEAPTMSVELLDVAARSYFTDFL